MDDPGLLDSNYDTWVISGSRRWDDATSLYARLDNAVVQFGAPTLIIQGGCPTGVDHLSAMWAADRRIEHRAMPAEWDAYKLAAGPIRNRAMLGTYPDALVVALPTETSVGTVDMIGEAKRRGRAVAVAATDGSWGFRPGVTQQALW